ncbi:MAG: SpoIID/LytB domain-containing protein [Candidatus Melainabacteria bacterium]|nr:SpoIID/LytB domain-containing protein [Candidatus Melainabacteria bacterium]
MTVKLFESHGLSSRLNVDGPFRILQPTNRDVPPGKYFFEVSGRMIHLRSAVKNQSFNLDAQKFSLTSERGIGMQYSTSKPRRYKGIVNLIKEQDALRVFNNVPTRDYILSVVGSESNVAVPLESAKAQAILTQTRVCQARPGDVVGDSTQEESYFGTEYVTPLIEKAVNGVWGQILTYQNHPIHIFYHSTCAGGTSEASKVFGSGASNMPYMKCVPCKFCQASPFWKPTVTRIPISEFKKQFGELPDVNTSDCAKRPTALTLHKAGRSIDMSGYQFWIKLGQKFGWDKAPGTRFKLTEKSDQVEIESTGAGHGVGMCQWGAAGMAARGKTCAEILNFYFPGTAIRKL